MGVTFKMEATQLELVSEQLKEISSKTTELRKQLHPLEEEQSRLYDEKKKLQKKVILEKAGFTEEQVNEIASKLSKNEVYVFYDYNTEDNECEDDGSIHVCRKGIRFCKEGPESALPGFARNVERLMKEVSK